MVCLIKRVSKKYFSFFILIVVLAFFSCKNKKLIIKPPNSLQCEYKINPLGIDKESPRLEWKLNGEGDFISQKAYQILVASDIEKLKNNIGDLWDTKQINSDQSTQIQYKGKKLKSQQKVFWKVRSWNEKNKMSAWSNMATWQMGLLKQSDWKAKWIGKDEIIQIKVGQKYPALYFRKEFVIKNNIKDALISISGLGYYELYINGKKVGNHVLSPNQTNYDKRQVNHFDDTRIGNMSTRVLYETFDVNSYLHAGKNVIAVILGNGWLFRAERNEYLPLSYDLPRFIAQLNVGLTNGKKQLVVSNASWKVNDKGPIVENSIYFGEVYDAQLEQAGWNRKGFDDSKWGNAKLVRVPDGKLESQLSPPDRVVGSLKPISISNPRKGVYRYDFGTMFSGWVKINVKGKKGSQLKIQFFEDNGNNYDQQDTYILKGKGIEKWEPRFTWHAFRYVEIHSPDIKLNIHNLEGEIVHTDVNVAGTFNSSNKLFNTILGDYKKTQLDNLHGAIPSDCPHRERRGYTGDGQISAQSAIYSLDMKSFYTKWLNDIADSQNKKTGYVPYTAPYQSGGGGTPWGSAYIIIPWYMYIYYGDISILKNHYDGMKHYIDYLKTQTDKDGLIDEKQLGEWVPPTQTIISPSFVSSAYFYYDLSLMHKIAKVLKKAADAKAYFENKNRVKKSFNNRYYKSKESSYSIGWQGANVFPLAFGLVSKENETNVFNTLTKNIEIKTKGHFDTGMMGTPYLLEVLTKYGRADLAYTVMNRRDFPSFGYNIERGATTIWETWTGNESHSHPMFGSVTAWFYQGLGGINPDSKNPGFKHIILKPNIVDELDFVKTTYPSAYGTIRSNWELKNGNFKWSINIPPNTSASVFIPGNNLDQISVNNNDAIFVKQEKNRLRFELTAGKYIFISKNIKKLIHSPMLSIPVINPPDSTLYAPNSILVKIRQFSKEAEIRYTLDGSSPKENSSLYQRPFKLKSSAIIKARTFRKGSKPSYIKTNRIVFIDTFKNGLNYNYYRGKWTKLPDFSKINPIKTGKIYKIDLNEFTELDNAFAILFSGEIDFSKNDIYTFYLSSNDGSRLFIDDKEIINFDGQHGFSVKTGKINLIKGKHKIRLEYFQAGGGKGLELYFESKHIEKQLIPSNILYTIN